MSLRLVFLKIAQPFMAGSSAAPTPQVPEGRKNASPVPIGDEVGPSLCAASFEILTISFERGGKLERWIGERGRAQRGPTGTLLGGGPLTQP